MISSSMEEGSAGNLFPVHVLSSGLEHMDDGNEDRCTSSTHII